MTHLVAAGRAVAHRGGRPWGLPLAACVGLLGLTSACAPTANSLSKSLAFASFEFNEGVRWRKYQQAARRLSPDIRDAYLDHAERTDEGVNVSEVHLLRSQVNVKKKSAVLRFRFVWHLTKQGLVRRSVVVEHWRQIKDVWFVTAIRPGSDREFPLFVGLTPEAQRKKKSKTKPRRVPSAPKPKARRAPPPRRG